MHIDELRKIHDKLCVSLHTEAVLRTNELVDIAYIFFDSNSFNFSVPASRNIYQSGIYNSIVDYLLVTKLWETQSLAVTVDSLALKFLLMKHANAKKIKVKVKLNKLGYLKQVFKVPLRCFKVLSKMLFIRKNARIISCDIRDVYNIKDGIFVDTDMILGSFHIDGYSNRSFGSLFEFLTEDEKKRTFIVPRFLALSDFGKMRDEVRQYQKHSGLNIFCKESIFSFREYVSIIWEWANTFTLSFKTNRLNLFPLISEELFLKSFSEITFESFVCFRFMEHLRRLDMPIKIFLNWNENHLYDRAYAKGYEDFKLNFRFVAYQGVVLDLDYDFYIQPTVEEIKKGLFPKVVFSAGAGLESIKSCFEGVDFKSTPVFRMKPYLMFKKQLDQKKTVLVGLSLVQQFSTEILEVAILLAKKFPEYAFKVRCHPLHKMSIPTGISNMRFDLEKNLINSLMDTSVLISAGSSLVLEAAIMKIPTLIVRSLGQHGQNPIPDMLRDVFTRVVTVESDLDHDFTSILDVGGKMKEAREEGAKTLYSEYVSTIGRKSVEALIG